MSDVITYNETTNRYEQDFGGAKVFAKTHKKDGVLYIDYVEADPVLRGSGAAGKFMENLIGVVKAENLKAIPICGYAASWLRRHSEYDSLIEKN